MSGACRVLLVDDSDELREATRELLEEMGHTVSAASRADQAIELFTAAGDGSGFDVLVSDVYMPGASGLELTEALLVRDRELAVLLISSRGGEPELRRRLAAGDVAFLAKPFAPEELASAVVEARSRVGERGQGPTALARHEDVEIRHEAPRRGSRFAVTPAARLAAALVLVLGAGALLPRLELGAPSLPAPGPDVARRSATVSPLAPVGAVAALPSELGWHPVVGAGAYGVRLSGVDGTVLWRAEVDAPRAELPAEIAASLHPAVTYFWNVEAFDAEGRRVASSGPVRFSTAPPNPGP